MISAVIMVPRRQRQPGAASPDCSIQVIVPVAQHKKPGVLKSSRELYEQLSQKYRVKLDDSDNSPAGSTLSTRCRVCLCVWK